MPTGELLRQLFLSHARRDDGRFMAAAEALIREEREKNHRLLADDLERLLRNGARPRPSSTSGPEVPKDKERGLALIEIREPDYGWERVILPAPVLRDLDAVVEENRRAELLAAYGLRPRQRLLFYGPPGCGKTLAAGAIGGALGIPLATVRFDALVSSYLGETAANLRRVFEFVERGMWVVLFDEFDAIGKDRDNPQEHGELKRVVNALLQMIDSYRGRSLLVAATNHQYLLDSALWRRFDAVVPFGIPSRQERILMLRMFLRGMADIDLNTDALAGDLAGATGSDIELIATDAARHAVIAGRKTVRREDMLRAIRDYRKRMQAIAGARQPDETLQE